MTTTTEEQKLYEDLEVLVWGSPATLLKRRAETALRAARLDVYAKAIEKIEALREAAKLKTQCPPPGGEDREWWNYYMAQVAAYDAMIARMMDLKRELESTS